MSIKQEQISVLMLAYNHGPYIRQAIESVLAQQCDHPFRLWIGEDNSSDDTRAVCRELQTVHSDRIELLCSDESLGMHGNFSNLWKHSSGEFVAFCEGDDYWSDPFKLQKQVDWMEMHPENSMCGTFTDIISRKVDGTWEISGQVRPPVVQSAYSFEDLIPSYTFHFSSVMVRRGAVQFPVWFQSVYCVDRPLYLLAAQNGPAGLLPEVTSVYRLHAGGAWSTLDMRAKADRSIHLFETMMHFFPAGYRWKFRRTLGDILWAYTGQAVHCKDWSAAGYAYRASLHCLPALHYLRYFRQHTGLMARAVWRK